MCMSKWNKQWKTGRKFIFFNYEGQWFYEGYDCVRAASTQSSKHLIRMQCYTLCVHQFKFHVKFRHKREEEMWRKKHPNKHKHVQKFMQILSKFVFFSSREREQFHISFWLFLSVILFYHMCELIRCLPFIHSLFSKQTKNDSTTQQNSRRCINLILCTSFAYCGHISMLVLVSKVTHYSES